MNNQKLLLNNHFLLFIPSWSNFLGFPKLHSYLGQEVTRIKEDPVFIVVSKEATVKTPAGTFHFLFGLGYHSFICDLSGGNSIEQSKIFTGLVLSDFAYDFLASSKKIALSQFDDILLTEQVVKIPLNLKHKGPTERAFIKGTMSRQFFLPHKEVLAKFVEQVLDQKIYNLEKHGHFLLSTDPNNYNQYMVSHLMEGKKGSKMMESMPCVSKIEIGAESYLHQFFNEEEIQDINNKVTGLKNILNNFSFEKNNLGTLIDYADYFAPVSKLPAPDEYSFEDPAATRKLNLIESAAYRTTLHKSWPSTLKRRSVAEFQREMLENLQKIRENKGEDPENPSQPVRQVTPIASDTSNSHSVTLRSQSPKFVKSKSLPVMPTSSILEILQYLRYLVEEDFEVSNLGRAFESAHSSILSMTRYTSFMSELSKYGTTYQRREHNEALNWKEKEDLKDKLDNWIEVVGNGN